MQDLSATKKVAINILLTLRKKRFATYFDGLMALKLKVFCFVEKCILGPFSCKVKVAFYSLNLPQIVNLFVYKRLSLLETDFFTSN